MKAKSDTPLQQRTAEVLSRNRARGDRRVRAETSSRRIAVPSVGSPVYPRVPAAPYRKLLQAGSARDRILGAIRVGGGIMLVSAAVLLLLGIVLLPLIIGSWPITTGAAVVMMLLLRLQNRPYDRRR